MKIITLLRIRLHNMRHSEKLHKYLKRIDVWLIGICLALLGIQKLLLPDVEQYVHNILIGLEILTVLSALVIWSRNIILRVYTVNPAKISTDYNPSKGYIYHIKDNLNTRVPVNRHYLRYINPNDVDTDLIKILKYYCEQRIGQDEDELMQLFRKLYHHNNHIFIMLFNHAHELVGLKIIIPMKKYLNNEHYRGMKSLHNLDLNRFIAKTVDTPVKLFNMHMVHIKKGHKCKSMLKVFESAMYLHIAKAMSDAEEEIILYSEAHNKLEETIYTDLGYLNKGKRKNKLVYQLAFDGIGHGEENSPGLEKWNRMIKNIRAVKQVLNA